MTIEALRLSLQKPCPLDNGQFQPRTDLSTKFTAPLSNLGALEALPPEVIHLVFNTIDLQSLTAFRAISWGARALVDSFSPYNAIFQYFPDALRALLSTQMAVHFTAQDILEAL